MKKAIILLLTSSLFLSSCASILNGKYQKVTLNTTDRDEILIDGEKPLMKKGKYIVARDLIPKQITIRSEGYKDDHKVLMQYKRSAWYIMSWVPFGIVFWVTPAFDRGEKAWNYASETDLENRKYLIENKTSDSKDILVNKVSVDLDEKDVKFKYFDNYKDFIKNKEKLDDFTEESDDEIKIEHTIFSEILNELLKAKGFIDTTNTALKSSFSNNLYLNAKIKEYSLNVIGPVRNLPIDRSAAIYIDLSVDWEVLDFYQNGIYSETTITKSGEFVIHLDNLDEALKRAMKDAMEIGLIELMAGQKVKSLLVDKIEFSDEEALPKLVISQNDKIVSNLNEAIKSSVTIKTNNGFGSGFFISSNGHVLTNYHVVAGGDTIEVVLNDKTKFIAEVVRESKIYDLALLKIGVEDVIPFRLSESRDIEIAAEVYAVGTPTAEDLSQTVSKGIVSGLREYNNGSELIQTDASINSGNSGGPLVLKNGIVLGVVSAKVKGYGIEGVAFGVPAYEVLDKLKLSIDAK